jgi:hypothetical protein
MPSTWYPYRRLHAAQRPGGVTILSSLSTCLQRRGSTFQIIRAFTEIPKQPSGQLLEVADGVLWNVAARRHILRRCTFTAARATGAWSLSISTRSVALTAQNRLPA